MTAKPKFKFLEKLVTADIAFEAFGKNLNEVFENSAFALCATMVQPKSMVAKIKKIIKMQNKDINTLLIDFLNELIYYKDAESLLFPKVKVKIVEKNGIYLLTAEVAGEKIDFQKHKVLADVKAATWHLFELQKKGKAWRAQVVLDI
ncbi:MAG: archease [Candidatus Nanoarchaeia archaeon]